MIQSKKICHLLFFLTALLTNLQQQQLFSQSLDHQIDSLVQIVFNDDDGPGGAFMVAKNGVAIYQKSFGKANLEWDVDLTGEAVFQLGSMTKQFTAIAVLMLEEQGKWQVTDTISKYLVDYPAGNTITIHHLLTHTSGIKDFTKMKALKDIAQQEMTPAEVVDFFKNEPVDFKPGAKFEYNNSGYVLLGHLIEVASGLTYADFIKTYIFDKVGMTHSYYASDRLVIPHRANGYSKKESGYVHKMAISFTLPFASGALMSTANDMLKWQNALTHHVLLSPESTKKAFSSYLLNDGEPFTYGYGWHIKTINGMPSREHGGSIFGFKTMGVYIPSEDIYILGFSNCDCNSPTQTTLRIAELVLSANKP